MEITKTMQELKDEATELGLDFKGMKSKAEIQELIDGASQTADDFEEVEVAEEEVEVESKPFNVRKIAGQLKKAAMAKKIVKIHNNDKRDSHVTTTCYLSCENQHFGLSKIVPLDVAVELEQCLIDVALETQIINHVDEIVEGKRTGNKVPMMIAKYSVSYEDVK